MQNDRSSSQFSLDSIIIPMYIHTKKKMIITRKETRDQDRGEGRDERKTSGEKQGGEAWNRIGRTSKLFRISFNDDDSLFFFFFSKYLLSISRIIETLDSSTLRMSVNFSSRYVRKKKKKTERRKRTKKRGEKKNGGAEGGSEGERRRKQRGGGKSGTMGRMKRKKEAKRDEEAKEK